MPLSPSLERFNVSSKIGTDLPQAVVSEICSDNPPLRAVPVISIDDAGFPHVALLALIEFFLFEKDIYFHVSASSRSREFLLSRPLCTCLFLSQRGCVYVKCKADTEFDMEGRTVFKVRTQSVIEDKIPDSETGAFLLSGLDFKMGPESVLGLSTMRERIIKRIRQRAI